LKRPVVIKQFAYEALRRLDNLRYRARRFVSSWLIFIL